MKHIVKHAEPHAFSAWKSSRPGAVYNDLKHAPDVKADLKRSLLSEQGCLCCYCERTISEGTSHIEHFKPKDSHQPYADLQLDYGNLHACCNLEPTSTTPNICGVKKGNVYSPSLISPLEVDCASHFAYGYDGSIRPSDAHDTRAVYTISLLGLNDAFLQALRKSAIEPFLDDTLTAEEIETMKEDYLSPNPDGTLNSFYSTIASLF